MNKTEKQIQKQGYYYEIILGAFSKSGNGNSEITGQKFSNLKEAQKELNYLKRKRETFQNWSGYPRYIMAEIMKVLFLKDEDNEVFEIIEQNTTSLGGFTFNVKAGKFE